VSAAASRYASITNSDEKPSQFCGSPYFPLTGFSIGRRGAADADSVAGVGDSLAPPIEAPFGLADLFALHLCSNPRRKTPGFARTSADVLRRWPELVIENEP
jgi:hypothetical protein